MGEKVGCADSAKTLVNKLKAKLSQDAMKIRLLPKKLVYFEGAPSWMRDLLANVGIELVEADDVEDKNPELIFLIDPKNCKKEWKEVKAVKNNKLLPINPLVIRPGPRLVESAEALGAMVYPSHFSTFGSMMEVLDQYYKDVEPIDLKTAFEY